MAILPKAILKQLIGINSNISNNVFFFDEQTILYPCGCYCVFYNMQHKTMKMLKVLEERFEISAMTLSRNRNFLAVAYKCGKPFVNIIDLFGLRKKKTLICQELHTCSIISLCFSPDSRCVVAICDDPLRTLLYWPWEKIRGPILAKVMVSVSRDSETLYHVSFDPCDPLNVYVFGNRLLKLFRFVENQHKQFDFPKIVPQDFKCYSWDTNHRLLVGTGSGRVLCIEDMYLKLDFNVFLCLNIPNDAALTHGVTAIVCYSKGFITACGTNYVQFFERDKIRDTYKFVRNVLLPSDILKNNELCNQIIKWMVVNPSGDVLVISTNMKQLYSTQVNPPKTKNTTEPSVFDVLVYPFHYRSITGCCVCVWKPLIATSSLDGSIKLWNYETFTLEFSKDFSEEIYSISMHPTGLFLLAGFSNELRFMHILKDDFKPFKNIEIYRCTHCNFSQGGHKFAAVNNNFIHVYSSITFELLANLGGHKDIVQATAWCMNDNYLISCGLDGAVCEWEIKTEKPISACVLKSCACNNLAINTQNGKLYVVSSDHSLKEIHKSSIMRTFTSSGFLATSVALSWSNTMLFVGTNNGHIRSMEYHPIESGQSYDYPCHSLETTHMIFTSDGRYLISTSKDASIAVWKINPNLDNTHVTVWDESTLISMKEIKEKMSLISKLKSSVAELTKKNMCQMYIRDTDMNAKIKMLSSSYNKEIANLNIRCELLKDDYVKEISSHEKKTREIIDDHCAEIEFKNRTKERMLKTQYENIKYLEDELITRAKEQEEEIEKLNEMQACFETRLANEYQQKIEVVSNEIYECQKNILLMQEECNKTEKMIEEDADVEALSIKVEYEKLLYVERSDNTREISKCKALKKEVFAFPKQLQENEDECWKLKMELVKLKLIKKNLEETIVCLRKEMKIQSEGLTDEDKRFCELKIIHENVTKLQCKLEGEKIFELRQLLEDKITEISKIKKQMASMRKQMESITKQFSVMKWNISDMNWKLVNNFKGLDYVREQQKNKRKLWKRLCCDLVNHVYFKVEDLHQLKNGIKSLCEKYIVKNVDEIVTSDPNLLIEWARRQNLFEYSIHKLKSKVNSINANVNQSKRYLLKRHNNMAVELHMVRLKNSRRLLSIAEKEK